MSIGNVVEVVENTRIIEQTAQLLPVLWLKLGHKAMIVN